MSVSEAAHEILKIVIWTGALGVPGKLAGDAEAKSAWGRCKALYHLQQEEDGAVCAVDQSAYG